MGGGAWGREEWEWWWSAGVGDMGTAGDVGSDRPGVVVEEEGEKRLEGRAEEPVSLRDRVRERYSMGMGGGTAVLFLGDDSTGGEEEGEGKALDAWAASMMEAMCSEDEEGDSAPRGRGGGGVDMLQGEVALRSFLQSNSSSHC